MRPMTASAEGIVCGHCGAPAVTKRRGLPECAHCYEKIPIGLQNPPDQERDLADAIGKDSVSRLGAVMALLKENGARVHTIYVGDLRVSFAIPWPPLPVPAQVAEVHEDQDARSNEARLVKLREMSRKTFCRVLPDDQLLQMEGAL
jgi:hypothetical protein